MNKNKAFDINKIDKENNSRLYLKNNNNIIKIQNKLADDSGSIRLIKKLNKGI